MKYLWWHFEDILNFLDIQPDLVKKKAEYFDFPRVSQVAWTWFEILWPHRFHFCKNLSCPLEFLGGITYSILPPDSIDHLLELESFTVEIIHYFILIIDHGFILFGKLWRTTTWSESVTSYIFGCGMPSLTLYMLSVSLISVTIRSLIPYR